MILPRCLGVEVRERSGTEWLFIDVEYLRATVVRENSLSLSQFVIAYNCSPCLRPATSRAGHGGAARRTFVYRVHRGG